MPGEVTAQGLARLPGLLDEHRPKLLLLCLGGNDMLQRLDPAATEANLRDDGASWRAAAASRWC